MKILITGVTGLIGKHLALKLMQDGHEVFALAKDPASVSFLPPQNISVWDIGKTPIDLKFIEGKDAIVHLAGAPIADGRWTVERKHQIESSRTVGTHEWAEAIRQLSAEKRPEVFVCASAVGFYGDRGDELLTESSSPGNDFLANVTQKWEAASQPIEALGVRLVNIRTAVVLAQNGGALEQMKPVVLGDGSAWMSWIHLEDEIGILEYAIKNQVVRGAINASSPHPVTNKEFMHALAKAKSTIALATPKFVLKAALGEMSEVLLASQRALPEKAKMFGYSFKFPELQAALAAIYSNSSDLDTHFESAQFVPANIEEIFSFFSRAENLETITPPWVGFKILKQSTPSVEANTLIDYRLKIHGVPLTWRTRIEEWNPGERFVDSQVMGPYSKWVHEHRFFKVKGGTLMLDHVVYRVPVKQVGKMLLGKFIGNDVKKIFAYRKEKIMKLFPHA